MAGYQEIAIAVVQSGDNFLVGQRPDGVRLAGKCEFPGGKVHLGEAPGAAALRECSEETGVEVRITGCYPPVDHRYTYGKLRLHFFHCAPVDSSPSVPKRPFRWVPRRELSNYDFPAANQKILQAIFEAGEKLRCWTVDRTES